MLVNEREVKVAGTLVDALQEPFDPSRYHDRYREALLQLIESKTEGKQVVVPEGEGQPAPVGDLMAALRASIEAAKQRKGGSSAGPAPGERRERSRKSASSSEKKTATRSSKGRKKAAA